MIDVILMKKYQVIKLYVLTNIFFSFMNRQRRAKKNASLKLPY